MLFLCSKFNFSKRQKLISLNLATPTRPPYNGLYGARKVPPEKGTFFRLEVYKKVGISLVEVQKRTGKTNISVFKRASKTFPKHLARRCALLKGFHFLWKVYKWGTISYGRYMKGVPFLSIIVYKRLRVKYLKFMRRLRKTWSKRGFSLRFRIFKRRLTLATSRRRLTVD